MSYILEALKKSQAERELGHVPTLETPGTFSQEKKEAERKPWGLLAVALAGVAVVIALYAALRAPDVPTAPIVQAVPVAPAPILAPPVTAVQPPGPQVAVSPAPAAPIVPPAATSSPAAPMDDLKVTRSPPAPKAEKPSEPLVEPPPPKRAERTAPPAGADHFDSHGDDDPYAVAGESDMDAELELELQQQIDEEGYADENISPEAVGDPSYGFPPPLPRGQIPDDLVNDINAFKRSVGGKGESTPAAAKSAPTPAPAPKTRKFEGDPTKLRLTRDQQAALPAYFMTVHVYDKDVSKRFVLINGLRYREGEKTREGLTIEQIVPDGVVLGFHGSPFFVHR